MSVLTGMNVHLPTENDIIKMVELRLQWVRMDFDWTKIEPHKGEFNWEPYDEAVDNAVVNGLKIYATLGKTPVWCGKYINGVPAVEDWSNFVMAVSSRYGCKIDVYSIWNEPNLPHFWAGSMLQYIDVLLIPAASILRNKGLTIAAPDLSTHGSGWTKWLDKMIEVKDYYDILSIHTYENTAQGVEAAFSKGRFGFLQRFYEPWKPYNNWLKKIGKPIWLTEVGWRSDKVGVDKQATLYLDLITKGIKSADEVIAYELRDDSNTVQKWGAVNSDGSDKPAAMIIENG